MCSSLTALQLFIGWTFFFIERRSFQGLATAIEYVDAIGLFYIVRASGHVGKKRLQLWEIKLLEQSEMHNFSQHFDFYLYGDQVS